MCTALQEVTAVTRRGSAKGRRTCRRRLWPTLANPILANPFLANLWPIQFSWLGLGRWVTHGGGERGSKGEGPNPEKVGTQKNGARRVGGPKGGGARAPEGCGPRRLRPCGRARLGPIRLRSMGPLFDLVEKKSQRDLFDLGKYLPLLPPPPPSPSPSLPSSVVGKHSSCKGGARKGGVPKGRGPKFRAFFPSPATIFCLSLSWEFFRGILVVFEAPGA